MRERGVFVSMPRAMLSSDIAASPALSSTCASEYGTCTNPARAVRPLAAMKWSTPYMRWLQT
jgi:hypothetical protein